MLAAIAGESLLERSYRTALGHGYLWHEFGDSHLILPDALAGGNEWWDHSAPRR